MSSWGPSSGLRNLVSGLLNKFLAPYVENLNTDQLNISLWSGEVALKGLKLKREALDKFRLPVDVIEGHLGTLRLSVPYSALGTKPVSIYIEDVYLLAVPSGQNKSTPEEDEKREQAAKQERLDAAEAFDLKSQVSGAGGAEEQKKNESALAGMIQNIVNNVQITIKNIHVRYEDKLSTPEHPFAIGATLAEFKAISTDENWMETFIHNSDKALHKMAQLSNLAIYFDTDVGSIVKSDRALTLLNFSDLITRGDGSDMHKLKDHQFILKPVTGEGRIIMNHKVDKNTPVLDCQLLFQEFGFVVDDDQYRDALSMLDLFHFYTRTQQYQRFRPIEDSFKTNPARSRLRFALDAIRSEVHERDRKWSWAYFAERRDDRKKYVELYVRMKTSVNGLLVGEDLSVFQQLERKLSYEDIRFYRSIAKSELRKDAAARQKLEEEKKAVAATKKPQGWIGWAFGAKGKSETDASHTTEEEVMTDSDRRGLLSLVGYDPDAQTVTRDVPNDALKLRVTAKLQTGSFALRQDPHGKALDIVSIVWDALQADVIQYDESMDATVTLGGFRVYDGFTTESVYPQIVRVKEEENKRPADLSVQEAGSVVDTGNPFFSLKFEHNPVDGRADNGLTVKMRHLEIIYHKGYVERVFKFFQPPESQLESITALIDVASETLDGIRKETRAGLELALQNHKTIDIKLDMNAPIIIIPENVVEKNCQHIVLDAGHIAVSSDLVAKEAMQQIESKKAQQYTEEDFQRLESLMYDRFTIRLDSAQLLMGNSLEACISALDSTESNTEVHVLERINMTFLAQNAILNAPNITKFKVSGQLPVLQLNFSDRKYKTLMRFIDVAIPKFGDDDPAQPPARPPLVSAASQSRHLSTRSGGFRQKPNIEEYNLDENESVIEDTPDADAEADADGTDEFYEAPEITSDTSDIHQIMFEFKFDVKKVQASFFKSQSSGPDVHLLDAVLEGFYLEFALRKFDLGVDVFLRSVSLAMIENGVRSSPLISSDVKSNQSTHDDDLVRVKYSKVQADSPGFQTVWEGVGQTIAVELSTFNFAVSPVPVLTLYDYIMTTFVPKDDASAAPSPKSVSKGEPTEEEVLVDSASDKIRVRVKLTRARVSLFEGTRPLATLSMAAGEVSLLLRGPTMRLGATLGHLSLKDDSSIISKNKDFKQLLSVEGDDVVDFSFESFDANDHATFPGYSTSIYLRAGSLKFNFMEGPIRDLYMFALLFSKLQPVYDATSQAVSQAATQRASELQKERMHFDILIKTPIIVMPRNETTSKDVLIMRLGEIVARNTYDGGAAGNNIISAGLHGIKLTSEFYYDDTLTTLQVISDMSITFDVIQPAYVDRTSNFTDPDTKISGKMSEVKLALTQSQYNLIMQLVQSMPRVLDNRDDLLKIEPKLLSEVPSTDVSSVSESLTPNNNSGVDLRPELGMISRGESGEALKLWTKLDMRFEVSSIRLELFDSEVTTEASLAERSIAKFALLSTRVSLKMLSDGALDLEVMLRDMTMSNTRAGNSKWRQIIPAATHNGDQFMMRYTMSGGTDGSALAIITIDSPRVILAIDPLYALLQFFTSGSESSEAPPPTPADSADSESPPPPASSSKLAYRVEIVSCAILVLEDDTNSESQAIELSVDQLLMSQQGILALNLQKAGMSLSRMDKPSESVRFLDDIDLTLSIDSRSVSNYQTTEIELAVQPIIFRASYRDITLITNIVNRATSLLTSATSPAKSTADHNEEDVASSDETGPPASYRAARRVSRASTNTNTSPTRSTVRRSSNAQPKFVISTEHLKASFEGFQLILIGDLHELPLLHLHAKAFSATVSDWSGDMKFITSLKPSITYFNLTNSAWEPLLEPYHFTLKVSKSEAGGEAGNMAISFSSKERLELNVTSTFIELAITATTQWSSESERILRSARGGDAPYLIRNRTGYPIELWADKGVAPGSAGRTTIEDGSEVPWRFEDYKTLREHVGDNMHHSLSVQINGADWEQLKNIFVDREGEYSHPLRPRLARNPHRLISDVKLVNNVKWVTFRSPLRVENLTHVPVELIIIEKTGKPSASVYKIAPGEDCALPIEAAYHKRFKLRPDPGFDFSWSTESFHWEDLQARPVRTIDCRSHTSKEAPFRFQASAVIKKSEMSAKRYPIMTLRLRAPVEIENLLPFDIKYRVFDKNTSLNSSTFLRKGGTSPVHQVELSHLLLLSVQVQDTELKPSEFAIINTDNPDDFNIEDTLILADKQGHKLNLKIHYIKYPEPSGAFKVQIFSPFIILNKVGLPVSIKSKTWMGQPRDVAGASVFTSDYKNETPTPLMFSFANSDQRNRCFLKFGDSTWSKPLSFETVAADFEVTVDTPNGKQEVHAGVSYVEGLGKYKLSKIVTLSPRFVFRNNMDSTINVRQERSDGFIHLTPGERAPMHRLMKRPGDLRVVIAYQGVNEEWSAPFNISDIGSVHVTLNRAAKDGQNSEQELVRIEVVIEGPAIFITFSKESEPWPFRIQNETSTEISFCQSQIRTADNPREAPRPQRRVFKVAPFCSANWTWEFPAEHDKRLKIIANGKERLVDVMEIGALTPFRFTDTDGIPQIASIDVRADGPTQVLIISKYEQERSAFKPAGRGTLSRSNTLDSTVAFEAISIDTSVTMTINVDFEGIGISILNKGMHEMVYISFRGLELRYVDTATSYSVSVNCKWIQVDNQLFGGLYPIILYPSVVPKDGKDLESHPTLQASVIVLKDESHGVLYIKYASILLQAMTIELDEDFAFALYDFLQFKGAAWQEVAEDVLIEVPGPIPDPTPAAGGPPVYFESLALQPIQLELSFMRTERVNVEEKQPSTRNPAFFVLNALTMALGNVNVAPVRLNALMVENVRLSIPALQNRIVLHYTNQFTVQLYRVLGSADAIGNPIGLFNNVSSGVHDIFYEPYQGFVLHGNKELASGIARGASSFVKKTVFGVTDSISKLTGSIGKGLSAATLDPEYQARRRLTQRKNKPRHALYGIAAGAQAFGTSVASGLEGLALKPLEGAESGGAGGFFKGVGKGLVGIVTKPVVGVFDFASTATQGIRNTTTVFDANDIDRVRLPRFVAADGVLRPFSGRESLGQSWLKDLENGKYFNEIYVAHLDFPQDDSVCMLTTTRILLIRSIKLRVVWEVAFWDLQTISLEPSGIALLLRDGVSGPFLPLAEQSAKIWLFKNIERVIVAYNQSRSAVESA
ncbi:Vacuolar protein sorting-associated protein [Phaffia rhodozyma]|uniref:Vacuolar protein sorting-associated protein n=1 Tax=Phaffia rhodozyma TaxID=264483 RepID=A0A0F7SW52_PHARH|nr:Vacuolar protein sorting-associated protein [Phaffia rhodozyma]